MPYSISCTDRLWLWCCIFLALFWRLGFYSLVAVILHYLALLVLSLSSHTMLGFRGLSLSKAYSGRKCRLFVLDSQ